MQGLFQREVRYKQQSGSVLIISLLMTSLFLAIGMTIARVNALDHKASTEIAYSNVAYQQAEIAMEFALNQIYNPISLSGGNTFKDYLYNANRPKAFGCTTDDFIQSPLNPTFDDPYFKIAIYNRDALPALLDGCGENFNNTSDLRKNIGVVRVWGYYKGTIRAVESKIILPD